jgi:hypothetical protein
MIGRFFHDCETVGETPGNGVSVGVSVRRRMAVGLGVREGAVTGSWKFAFCAGASVEVGIACVVGIGEAWAVQDMSKTQNIKFRIRFIRFSIAVKN